MRKLHGNKSKNNTISRPKNNAKIISLSMPEVYCQRFTQISEVMHLAKSELLRRWIDEWHKENNTEKNIADLYSEKAPFGNARFINE